ncbi:MAG TPA: PSD1 and planctomycete cytochrome C domain-containing protein [Blastocatellia bacterium]|nr:PSD1 and planctomycete cytochrome C domain-containing protein [Blastocatellia bacterium]
MRRKLKCLICIFFFVAVGYGAAWLIPNASAQNRSAAQSSLRRRIDFKRQVEPIFARSCFQCHGAKKAMGQLRLDSEELAMKGGVSGPSIIPGDGKQSLLLRRILGEGNEARMPMGGAPLKPAEIALIGKWIDQGANWSGGERSAIPASQSAIPRHWAYIKPVRPAAERVENQAWVRNPIDAFVLARLEKEGLSPSPEADKATLIRRLYLDLIGLPPSVKEIDEYLADTSPDAYEKAVDRLLSSQHYGERWARPWLDLARYADSNGYEKDNLRLAWKFRDWVINAFNKDMPFDQFTIEQIAGDMLPNATVDQKIATGFHRNTMVNQEGGIDPEEARFETLIDRVNTTATVWLGSTIACAQCHNHKYDPFSQKDFYRLMAFFDNAEYQIGFQSPNDDNSRYILEPQISLPTPDQDEKRNALDGEIKQLEAKIRAQSPEMDDEQNKWERGLLDEQNKWTTLDPIKLESTGGATLKKLDDWSVLVSGAFPERDVYVITAKTDLKDVTALRIEALPDASLPKGGPGRDPYGNFLLTGIELEVASPDGSQPREISFKDVFADDQAYRIETRAFFSKEPGNPATDRPPGWFVNATNDQTNRLPRQGVFLAAKPFGPVGAETGATLTIRLRHLGGSLNQSIGRFRLSITTTEEPKRVVSVSARLRPILSLPRSERARRQREDLSAQFRAATPLLKSERDRLEQLREEMKALNITTALVMQERQGYERPSTFFRERGGFLNKGEKMFASTPAALAPMPDSAPINRLGLARWLVDENNPLTARVMVNRFWEQIFGRGLIETSEDFGTQGERPSHPELLDWLAVEFMNPTWNAGNGGTRGQEDKGTVGQGDKGNPQSAIRNPQSQAWSMKRFVRLIVTSSTYRQSSATTPALLEKDPHNRLFARGPRFRMEAEMIRDVTLAASGLLSRKPGGPSVFPLQPDGVWKSPYSSEKWTVSKGEDRFRRSLYTFVRRSSPHPAMMAFDATSREYCTVRRVRTNTPLQALTTLNDDAAMDAARALAKRMIEEGGDDLKARLTYGFRACATRTPKEKEAERLALLYREQLNNFAVNASEAAKVAKNHSTVAAVAEFAAWTMVANVLLNLDETLTKE